MPSENPSKKALSLKNLLRTLLRSVRLHDPLGVRPSIAATAVHSGMEGSFGMVCTWGVGDSKSAYNNQLTTLARLVPLEKPHIISCVLVRCGWNLTRSGWKSGENFRKSVMSIKVQPAILGPEMAAPILWAPGIFGFVLLENPHAHKIPPFRGGGGRGFFWKGGWKCQSYFYGRGIFQKTA